MVVVGEARGITGVKYSTAAIAFLGRVLHG